jgi:hypothetical protein
MIAIENFSAGSVIKSAMENKKYAIRIMHQNAIPGWFQVLSSMFLSLALVSAYKKKLSAVSPYMVI